MINIQKDLKDFRFIRKGDMTIKKGLKYPVFNIYNHAEKTEGIVYMWVEEQFKKPIRILYIGKAGKSLKKRCYEHFGGFKGGSKKGAKMAAYLLNVLKNNAKVGIYSRQAKTLNIFGQENISLCSAEEKALINRYKDAFKLLNKL